MYDIACRGAGMDPLRACSFQEPASLMPNRANASQLKIAIGNGDSASGLINLRKEKKNVLQQQSEAK